MKRKFRFFCVVFVCGCCAVNAQDYSTKTPDGLDVAITYMSPESGADVEISGKLKFERLPLLLDGKPAGVPLRELVSFRYRDEAMTCWIRRDTEASGSKPLFLVCSIGAILRAELAFEEVAVVVAKKEQGPQWDWQTGAAVEDEELDDEELDALLEGKKKEAPPVVLELVEKKEGLKRIAAEQIKEVKIKTLRDWGPM